MVNQEGFFEQVYAIVRAVPRGRVTTYGAIAHFIGTGKSARLVGWAMNASHQAFPYVPAHRVVNRNGLLTGKHHFAYPEQMAQLLMLEGVEIQGDQILHFNDVFWDPSNHIKISNFEIQ